MQALTFFFAFVAVLALIGLAAWLVRRFAGNRLGTTANRGRMPRLAVIDAAAVDGRRRLVLVRRDNVEHLLMIGGPTDIVVESNIVRATNAREQLPQRSGLNAVEPQQPARIAPLPEPQSWPDNEPAKAEIFDLAEPQPMPELPQRPMRASFGDEGRRSPQMMAERRPEMSERRPDMTERRPDMTERRIEMPERREPLPGFPSEGLVGRPEPRPEPRQESRQELRQDPRQDPRHDLRGEPRLEPRPERPLPRGDLMRGEAPRSEPMRGEPILPRALRPAEPAKPPLPPPLAAPMPAPPPRAPERTAAPPPPPAAPPSPPPQQSAEANLAEMAQRLEAALRRPPGDAPQPSPMVPEPPPLRSAVRNEPPAPAPKTSFENLEDEMASLLGRPKSS